MGVCVWFVRGQDTRHRQTINCVYTGPYARRQQLRWVFRFYSIGLNCPRGLGQADLQVQQTETEPKAINASVFGYSFHIMLIRVNFDIYVALGLDFEWIKSEFKFKFRSEMLHHFPTRDLPL